MDGAGYGLPGAPGSMDWAQRVTPAAMFGLAPGAPRSKSAGAVLPSTSVGAGDGAFVPWSPDSPVFWGLVFVGLTLAGVAGASVRVRAFRGHAGADIGEA